MVLAEPPIDADLFSDKLCTNSDIFNTRRAEIVKACDDANDPTDVNCLVVVATGIDVNSCFTDPYQEECAHAAFGGQRAVGLSACNITTFVSMSTTGVDCIKVQTSVCGGGVYAADPFNAFCDKKDAANNDATIPSAILADGRNKYCQDSAPTAPRTRQGCGDIFRPARPRPLCWTRQTNALGESPDPVRAANQFLRGTADGLNTGGFVQKNGDFAFCKHIKPEHRHLCRARLWAVMPPMGIAYFAGRQHLTQGDIATEVDYYRWDTLWHRFGQTPTKAI